MRSREAKLAVATDRFRALLGRIDEGPSTWSGDLRRERAPARLDALQAQAFQVRPDLKAVERDRVRSAADVCLQIAQGKIDYTVRQVSSADHAGLAHGNECGLFVSARLPFFNHNQREAERVRQEAKQSAARIAALQCDIPSELRSAWWQFTTTRELVDTIGRQMLAQGRVT